MQDQRPEASADLALVQAMRAGPQTTERQAEIARLFGPAIQLRTRGREGQDEDPAQRRAAEPASQPVAAPPADRGGLPAALKAGVEALSGVSMDGVRVHYGSSRPAQLGALAFAQGNDIHLGPGQDRHLPHETWHVAQQRQGRVKPTLQAKGVPINNDPALEHEADTMGARAARYSPFGASAAPLRWSAAGLAPAAQLRELSTEKLNVVGEHHEESGDRRHREETICKEKSGGEYWLEYEFVYRKDNKPSLGDSFPLRMHHHFIYAADELDKFFAANAELIEKHNAGQTVDFGKAAEQQLVADAESDVSIAKGDIALDKFKAQKEYAKLYDGFQSKIKSLDDVIDTINAAIGDPESKSTIIYPEKTILKIRADAAAEVKSDVQSDTEEAISSSRSQHMHHAANQSANKKGVWKVGDAHATDMSSLPERLYELMSRTDFNNAYFPKAAKAQATAASGSSDTSAGSSTSGTTAPQSAATSSVKTQGEQAE